ncbi:MAG: hypothetical protein ACTHKE_00135 [Sphingomicrobium sp.]|jgi:hypothetical protein
MRIKAIVGLGAIAAALPSAVIAQTIEQRETRQVQRIEQAEAAGKLTPAQANQLKSSEEHLLRTEALMRWQYGGDLSQFDRQELQGMANQDSATISRAIKPN